MNYTLIYVLCLCQPFSHITWNFVPNQYTCRTRRKQQVKLITAILFTSYLYIPSSDPIRIAILVLTFKGIPYSFRWITPDTWRSWSAWRQWVGVTTSASSSPSVPWFSLPLPSWSGLLFSCLSWFTWWTTPKKVYTEISCFFDRCLQTYLVLGGGGVDFVLRPLETISLIWRRNRCCYKILANIRGLCPFEQIWINFCNTGQASRTLIILGFVSFFAICYTMFCLCDTEHTLSIKIAFS